MALSEPQLQLCSTLADDGTLTSPWRASPGPLEDNEVWVAVQAAPINPSDLGLLLAGADLSTAKSEDEGRARKVTATVPAAALPLFAGRLGHTLPVGNEGAGEVVAAGASAEAQALLGRTVASSEALPTPAIAGPRSLMCCFSPRARRRRPVPPAS